MRALVINLLRVAVADVERTMHRLIDFLIYDQDKLLGLDDEFKDIEMGMRRIQFMLKNVETAEGPVSQESSEEWEGFANGITEVTTSIENVINTFISHKRDQYNLVACVEEFVSVCANQTARMKLKDDLVRIKLSIVRVTGRGSRLEIAPFDSSRSQRSTFRNLVRPLKVLCPDDVGEGEVVGLEEDLQILLSNLISGEQTRRILCIVGERGIGKTTLAMRVYKNAITVDSFPSCAWITLPEEPDFKEALLMIAKQLIENFNMNEREWKTEELSEIITNFLRKSRYLIVLDDVHNSDVWNELKAIFPDLSNASRILMTTSDREIAQAAEPDQSKSYIYDMRPLSDEESWELFIAKVRRVPDELQELGREIVKKCMGLPLSISAAGEFLRNKLAASEEWSAALKEIDREQLSLYYTLNLSADALSSHLKQCLFYFGLFHQEYDIPVRRLIVLWVAEGLVQQHHSAEEPPEYIAEKYLTELITKHMIQVCKRKPDGSAKTCRMNYLLLDQWRSRLREANFVNSPSEAARSTLAPTKCAIRRLADHLDTTDNAYNHIHGSLNCYLKSYYKDLRSLLSFDSREGPVPGEEIGMFLRRGIDAGCFRRLRVVDLEGVFRPKLSKFIGKLAELRYLGLRWTYLEVLPSSIGNLLNLQTLDLKHTYISTLPRSFWKMQQLRHLYLSDSFRSRFDAPPSASSLTDLQTLWGVFLDEDSPVRGGLDRLFNLRKLGFVCRLLPSQMKELSEWIGKLTHLESLRLRSIDELVQPSNIYLDTLSGLESLSNIYLYGRLENPAFIDSLPKNLTEITLSLSGLLEDPMPKLEKLPKLRSLKLLGGSYLGTTMVCSARGFPLLRVLKLWKLEGLEEWTVEEGALTIVREIEIRSCKRLKMIPDGVRHLRYCRGLKLKGMPDEFEARLSKCQGEDWYKVAHIPFTIEDL